MCQDALGLRCLRVSNSRFFLHGGGELWQFLLEVLTGEGKTMARRNDAWVQPNQSANGSRRFFGILGKVRRRPMQFLRLRDGGLKERFRLSGAEGVTHQQRGVRSAKKGDMSRRMARRMYDLPPR